MALILAGGLPAMPDPSDVAWSQPNADATYVATQTAKNAGCHLAVVHLADKSTLWQSDACFGGRSDPVFLSRDGQRLMVLSSLPSAAGQGASRWRQSEVAWLFDRGALVESARAGQLVKRGSDVRLDVSHFSWLQGVNGVPGVPPHLSSTGDAVELDAIDGTHRVLPFSGFALPAPARARHRRRSGRRASHLPGRHRRASMEQAS